MVKFSGISYAISDQDPYQSEVFRKYPNNTNFKRVTAIRGQYLLKDRVYKFQKSNNDKRTIQVTR